VKGGLSGLFTYLSLYCGISDIFLDAVDQEGAVAAVLLPGLQWLTLWIFANEHGLLQSRRCISVMAMFPPTPF